MIKISQKIFLNPAEIKLTFVASSGPGGQNVNKVATAAHLRFNVLDSRSLPEDVCKRLVSICKLTVNGELIIKANCYRTREQNKNDAIERLCRIIKKAAIPIKKRKKTKPTKASKEKRLANKKLQSQKKSGRQQIY